VGNITGSGRKKELGEVASNGSRRCAARCPAATRTAGELRPLNRRSCLGEGVTTSVHGDHRSQGMGGGDGGDAVGWSAQVGFTRPVSVRRVATEDWVRTSVRGLGTGGHNGVPAFVPGRSAARPGAVQILDGPV
jgi:hypothetical protein